MLRTLSFDNLTHSRSVRHWAAVCLAVAALSAAAIPHGHAQSQNGDTEAHVRALLGRMRQAEETLRLSGIQVTTVVRSGKVIKSEQRVVRDGARAMRTEYLAPPRLAGEVLIDNGKTFWHYIPAKRIMETGPSDAHHTHGRLYKMLRRLERKDLIAEWNGRDKVAGRTCEIVDVAPRAGGQQRHWRFWIDSENGAQLGIETSDSQWGWRSTTQFREVRFSPSIDARTFTEPSVPGYVQIVTRGAEGNLTSTAEVQKQAGFPIGQPSYLPAGYAFQSGGVTHFGHRKGAMLRYVSGVNVLSLFEFPSRDPGESEAIEHPRPKVATMKRAGLRLVLVGNIEPAEADRILQSVR